MIIRTQKNKNYTSMSNIALRDKRLSAKAKGIFAYVMTLPDDWKFYASELKDHFTDGESSILSGLKELENLGYLVRNRMRDKGIIVCMEYTFNESPQLNEPQPTNPVVDKPIVVNPQLLSTNLNQVLNIQKDDTIKSALNQSTSEGSFDPQSNTPGQEKKDKKASDAPVGAHVFLKAYFEKFSEKYNQKPVLNFKAEMAKTKNSINAFRLSENDLLRGLAVFFEDQYQTSQRSPLSGFWSNINKWLVAPKRSNARPLPKGFKYNA